MVVVDRFTNKRDAFDLISLLEKNNIPYIQQSEDLGGKLGSFYLPSGVKILVSEDDIEKVNALIHSEQSSKL